MNVEVFIDTNILVYAHDRQAGEKHHKALALIASFWEKRQTPSLSIQVLQELHVSLTRKGIEPARSGEIASRYLSWHVIDNTRHLFAQALTAQQRWKISYWDALIVTAAQRAGVSELWSEDLNPNQNYGTVRVVNPLA